MGEAGNPGPPGAPGRSVYGGAMTSWFRGSSGNKGWQGDEPVPAEEVRLVLKYDLLNPGHSTK